MNVAATSSIFVEKRTAKAGLGTAGRVLTLWYLLVMFTVFSLQVGDLRITCFFALPAALAMFARNMNSANRREMWPLALLLGVALLSVIAGKDAEFIGERSQSFVLFCYSIFMAYALRLELGRAQRSDVSWISGWLLSTIMIAAVLERLGPLRPASDAFRAWNSPYVYAAERRDLIIAGFIRPSIFTAEPSYAALGIAVFSIAWFVSTKSRYRVMLFGLVTVLALILIRSPILAISLPPVGLILLAGAFRQSSRSRRAEHVFFAVTFLMFATILSYLGVGAMSAARGGIAGDQSLAVRLVAPPRIAAAVLGDSPMLGAGLGGRGVLLTEFETVFHQLDLTRAINSSNNEIRLPNVFWEHWIYFGLAGGVIAAYAIVRYFRTLCGGNCIAAALFLFLLANSFGGYSTPRFWSFATLVVIATALAREDLVPHRESGAEIAKGKTTTLGGETQSANF